MGRLITSPLCLAHFVASYFFLVASTISFSVSVFSHKPPHPEATILTLLAIYFHLAATQRYREDYVSYMSALTTRQKDSDYQPDARDFLNNQD